MPNIEATKQWHYITGSHGFVGEHLCKRLEHVTRGKRDSIEALGRYIVDLAAYGNMSWQNDTIQTYRVNLERVIRMLRTTQQFDSFILTSTSAIQLDYWNDYTIAKEAMEHFAIKYAKQRNLPICVYRPSSITGIDEQQEHLIPRLIKSCLFGVEIEFVEKPTHDFIDVEDVVSGILCLEENIKKCKGRVFNISSNKKHSNKQVKEMIESITKRKAVIKKVDKLREYDSEKWVVDNGAIKKFGWKPTKTLEEIICEMVSKEKSLI